MAPNAPSESRQMTAAKEFTPETVAGECLSQGDNQRRRVAGAPPLPAAQTAHDLANSLTGIRMLVQSLSHVSPDQPAIHQHIASLQRAALHASELCDQLQNILAGEKGEQELDVCEIDIGAMVSAMRRLLEVMVRSDANLKVEAAVGVPPVIANPTQLRQVILDLVTNASDALGCGNGSISIRTGVFECNDPSDFGPVAKAEAIDADDCVVLEVTDTGGGIAEDKLQRTFEPTFTTKKDGQGLGLASVLQIVRSCGGTVTVDSRIGEGTRVRCVFPSATPEPLKQADAAATSSPLVDNSDSRAAPLLLIEDNEAARSGSKFLLENSEHGDFHVLTVGNGREAIDLFQRRIEEASVVVLDLNLPDCQGADLLRQMRQLAPQLPVIVVSGLPEEQMIAQCDGQKPDGILVKPFDGDALIDKVNSIFRLSDSQKGNPVV